MKKLLFSSFLILFLGSAFGQTENTNNAILWKVSGNGLSDPSYLFGTYHIISSAFVDTVPAIMNAFNDAELVAGELLLDSTIQAPIMEASVLRGTTLHEILPDSVYQKAKGWFMDEAGFDIMGLDNLNPITIMTVCMGVVQQKYFPNPEGTVEMDLYFQDRAKTEGKKVIGLESIDVQVNALFKQVSLERQVEIMTQTFYDTLDMKEGITIMNKAYLKQDLNKLQSLMYGTTYKPEEMKILLDDRNIAWAAQLPALMKKQPIFVAVGALHLAGDTGLVKLLREMGYEVTAINF